MVIFILYEGQKSEYIHQMCYLASKTECILKCEAENPHEKATENIMIAFMAMT